jgi:hypothetical protein
VGILEPRFHGVQIEPLHIGAIPLSCGRVLQGRSKSAQEPYALGLCVT